MLDVNLYTLSFVRSTNEPDKLFLIQESTGEPIYFRLRVPEGTETRTELYHAATLAPLGVLQPISSKLKLLSLANPSATIELKNSGYINFEWTFYFDKVLKFCWRKDIIGMAGSKRGYTCWMSRKPDPDYPCAIYRPGSSSVPPSCQFLDFNIRRIENLQDPRGLEFTIILALLGFTEAVADQEPRRSPTASPPLSQRQITSGSGANYHEPAIQPNELRVSENSSTSEMAAQGHKLFEDPLFLYLVVHAPNPKAFKRATLVAEQIKRDRLKRYGEELFQYLVDDIISQELATTGGHPTSPTTTTTSSSTNASKPGWLKVYLSRTPLDELLPKSVHTSSRVTSATKRFGRPQLPPKEHPRPSSFHAAPASSSSPFSSSSSSSPYNHSSRHSRFMSGVHRPFSKIASIASFQSRSSDYYQHHITPYYLEEEEEEDEDESDDHHDDDNGGDGGGGGGGDSDSDGEGNRGEMPDGQAPDGKEHHDSAPTGAADDDDNNNKAPDAADEPARPNAEAPPACSIQNAAPDHPGHPPAITKPQEPFMICASTQKKAPELARNEPETKKPEEPFMICKHERKAEEAPARTQKKAPDHSEHEPVIKTPEPFLICANELTTKPASAVRNNVVLFKEATAGVGRGARTSVSSSSSLFESCGSSSGATFSGSGGGSGRASIPESGGSSGGGVERASSVRSRSSTVRSSASSFVEIILSTCCHAYSAAFAAPADPAPAAPRSTPKPHHHHLPSSLKRIARRNLSHTATPINNAWKRLSSHSSFLPSSSSSLSSSSFSKPPSSSATATSSSTAATSKTTAGSSSDFVSNLFSRKIHFS
ncbi:hypothetical protein PCANC_06454 [Puccinia coronata f. sp. avenae]|uniref:Uncharacterized protein n=1 Tax=Puccinia coronata f. sp. avenae TaxID=200324 RepID=A0A2N5VVX1_9BASI|nr:hypothetical protein PCASD_16576 [Puccinia coronata f. sp. avenae]PLW34639.1 hypothetical protein PCASD_12003 [Puccinia coronata f. sp. avenae]PLW54147.1 hypothetical protein PCANC_06454 [Puccinia coronata f. sp. avenae]